MEKKSLNSYNNERTSHEVRPIQLVQMNIFQNNMYEPFKLKMTFLKTSFPSITSNILCTVPCFQKMFNMIGIC